MILDVINQAIAAIPPKQWPTFDGKVLDRSEFLSSSEVAFCLRRAFFGKYPEKYTPASRYENNGFAERGNAVEAWVVDFFGRLAAQGYTFEYMGDKQRSFYLADIGISGTPDGVMTTPEGLKYLLEIKSIDPRFNKSKLPKKGHIHQTLQNWALVEECLDIDIVGGVLIYFDASNLFDIKSFELEWSDEVFAKSLVRAKTLWEATSPDELEPEGVYEDDCEYCLFKAQCSEHVKLNNVLLAAGASAAPFLEDGDDTPLPVGERLAVEQWLAAREGAKQYKSELDEVRGEVDKIIANNHGVIKVEGNIVLSKMWPGRETIDKKLMAADGLDISKYVKVGAPYTKTEVKGDKE